jgi:C4-dicarboxylate-specific signal transduction histidine kinase
VNIQHRIPEKASSQENIHKLYTPFFITKKEVKGVGLGFPISYGLIWKHGDKIDPESAKAKAPYSLFIH